MPRKLVVSRRVKTYNVPYKVYSVKTNSMLDKTEIFYKPYTLGHYEDLIRQKCSEKNERFMFIDGEVKIKYVRCDMDIDYYFKHSRKYQLEEEK